jgi:hypothetical protein
MHRRLGGPRGRYGRVRNISALPEFEPIPSSLPTALSLPPIIIIIIIIIIISSTNCKNRTAVTLYTLETYFVSEI